MPNDIAHFSIHATDCQRAKRFYETVFGWRFEPWGPPGFWLIETSPGALNGSLKERYAPVDGKGMIGFECTIGVGDLAATTRAIEANGGKITMAATHIETVGTLVMFRDTEGNTVGAMQYEAS